MKVLLTGANGYIGKRLLPVLLEAGHEVICCVRDRKRFPQTGIYASPSIKVLEIDFLNPPDECPEIAQIDAAYYLIHSMSDELSQFEKLEVSSAENFVRLLKGTTAKQVIYLGGITNDERLSKHLSSRKQVDEILRGSDIPVTTLKAGIVVGSGSSSFEIIRDLVEKLPVMITPRWLNTRIQPIAISNVLEYLAGVLGKTETYHQQYDIGGPDVLTYKQMLLQLAELRGLKRFIWTLPVMTPRLSSYWLYFVTSTSYKLAVNLVNSMKVEVVAKPNNLNEMLGIRPISYRVAVALAFQQIDQNNVVSSWKDSFVSGHLAPDIMQHIQVPVNGCYTDVRRAFFDAPVDQVFENVWQIGGDRGWYYGNWLWLLRGFIDKVFKGVGLRRGRTSNTDIHPGDPLDFWRVLVADKINRRLLLYAEMKMPGDAWLEFRIENENGRNLLVQQATYRPVGLLGRLYWYAVWPAHGFIFNGMIQNIVNFRPDKK